MASQRLSNGFWPFWRCFHCFHRHRQGTCRRLFDCPFPASVSTSAYVSAVVKFSSYICLGNSDVHWYSVRSTHLYIDVPYISYIAHICPYLLRCSYPYPSLSIHHLLFFSLFWLPRSSPLSFRQIRLVFQPHLFQPLLLDGLGLEVVPLSTADVVFFVACVGQPVKNGENIVEKYQYIYICTKTYAKMCHTTCWDSVRLFEFGRVWQSLSCSSCWALARVASASPDSWRIELTFSYQRK